MWVGTMLLVGTGAAFLSFHRRLKKKEKKKRDRLTMKTNKSTEMKKRVLMLGKKQ